MSRKKLVYAGLQLKRFFRLFPFVLIMSMILCSAAGLALGKMIRDDRTSDQKKIMRVGITGDTSNKHLQYGISAVQQTDVTQYSLEFVPLTEEEAQKEFNAGGLVAYVKIPEGYMEDAIAGDVGKITYVTSGGAMGFDTKITAELMRVISTLIFDAQRALHAVEDVAFTEGEEEVDIHTLAREGSYSLIDSIIRRSDLYEVEEVGVSGSSSEESALVCGILVLFLLLWGITCCMILSVKDDAMSRVLYTKGVGPKTQVASEYFAYFMFMAATLVLLSSAALLVLRLTGAALPDAVAAVLKSPVSVVLGLLLPILAISAMQFFLYEVVNGVVNGVLVQFLCAVGLGYVSGCLYPAYFFPEAVQEVTSYLPAGAARLYLSGMIDGKPPLVSTLILLGYFALFLILSAATRRIRIKSE